MPDPSRKSAYFKRNEIDWVRNSEFNIFEDVKKDGIERIPVECSKLVFVLCRKKYLERERGQRFRKRSTETSSTIRRSCQLF